jgi:hypothetical protein
LSALKVISPLSKTKEERAGHPRIIGSQTLPILAIRYRLNPASTKKAWLGGGYFELHSIQSFEQTDVDAKSHMANHSCQHNSWRIIVPGVVHE